MGERYPASINRFQSPTKRVNTSKAERESGARGNPPDGFNPLQSGSTLQKIRDKSSIQTLATMFQSPTKRVNTSKCVLACRRIGLLLRRFNPLQSGSTLQKPLKLRSQSTNSIFRFQSPTKRVNTSKTSRDCRTTSARPSRFQSPTKRVNTSKSCKQQGTSTAETYGFQSPTKRVNTSKTSGTQKETTHVQKRVSIPYKAGQHFKRSRSRSSGEASPFVSIPYKAGQHFKNNKQLRIQNRQLKCFNPLQSGSTLQNLCHISPCLARGYKSIFRNLTASVTNPSDHGGLRSGR